MQATKQRKVVITGASLATPAGYSLEENYAAWREGRHAFAHVTTFNTTDSAVQYAGECPQPDVKRLPDSKAQKILRRKDVISLIATLDAAENAGLSKDKLDPERVGMYVGAPSMQIGDLTPFFALVAQCGNADAGAFDSARFGAKLMDLVNPLVGLQTLMNSGLSFASMTLDLRGVNATFMDFQAAGLRAVGEGLRSIATGRADVVIAGGIAAPVEPLLLADGVQSGFLANTRDLDIPLGKVVRPYDGLRRGTIPSEGAAYLVLENEGHAVKRGAKILGRLEGFGLAADGAFDFLGPHQAPGLVRSMRLALAEAGLEPDDLGLVVGHGSGSIHADGAEAKAYRDLFGDSAKGLPLVSPKGVLGDLGEAGGVVGLVLALEAMAKEKAPPTFNFERGDEHSSKLGLSPETQVVRRPRALVTARNVLGLSAAMVVSTP